MEKNYLVSLLKRQKGLDKYRAQFYIPEVALGERNSEQQKQYIVGLFDYITGRKKLIDYKFFIIAYNNKGFLPEHYLSLIDFGDMRI